VNRILAGQKIRRRRKIYTPTHRKNMPNHAFNFPKRIVRAPKIAIAAQIIINMIRKA